MEPICYYHRHRACMEVEPVYGEAYLRWAYGNPLGKIALHAMAKRPWFSRLYGALMNHPRSAAKIRDFITRYEIDADECAQPIESYGSFNEFFYRKLKPTARPIDPDPNTLVFPADGRHLGFQDASRAQGVLVKGQRLELDRLLGNAVADASSYRRGTVVISRLCPIDYHRFHFPCAGRSGPVQPLKGTLFSVSPIALKKNITYLWQNQRHICTLQSERFGQLIMVEIGATCVGSIKQTFRPGHTVQKGEEKGYFAFGGSCVITIFPPESVVLAADLCEFSSRMIELYARMGTPMAQAA